MIPAKLYFTAQDLQGLSTPQTFERAQKYFFQNRVQHLYQQGVRFHAVVQGSNRYVLDLWTKPFHAWCHCPYTGPGACKHIVAAGMALLAGSPVVEPWEEVDFTASALPRPFYYISKVNPLQVRDQLLAEKLPLSAWETLFQFYQDKNHWLELMDLSLGRVEALPDQFPAIHLLWQSVFAQNRIPPILTKELLSHFFERWYARERDRELPQDGNPLQITQWKALLLPLIASPLAAQYCRIRLEGYGLYGDEWQEIWNQVEKYG